MKRLLIVSETWYPDSRATISIMSRMAEGIAQRGVEVFAMPLKPLQDGQEYPVEHEGVKIVLPEEQECNLVSLKCIRIIQRMLRKLLSVEKRMMIGNPEKPWSAFMKKIRDYQRIHWLMPICDRVRDISAGCQIISQIEKYEIDAVLSVSAPFWPHKATKLALGRLRDIRWIAICFDPFAYIQSLSHSEARERRKCEHRVFNRTDKILMLSQSREDYKKDSLGKKMDFFEIPNIRRVSSDYPIEHVHFNSDMIECVCIGNLYWTVRNPESLFRMFDSFENKQIRLHIVGSLLQGFPEDYIECWKEKLGNRFSYCERVCSEEAAAIMNAADVLVNVGNTTSNQCPSKVLEYISTGKPILSISKNETCTSAEYLQRYPLAYLVRERNCDQHEELRCIEAFIQEKRDQRLLFEEIEEEFKDCTNKQAVDTVMNAFGR